LGESCLRSKGLIHCESCDRHRARDQAGKHRRISPRPRGHRRQSRRLRL